MPLLPGQPAPLDLASPATFRVENRYTGSSDVLGGGVHWPSLFLFHGVRTQPEQPDPETEEEEVCATCGGTGEVSAMERVYPGEPHMADVGSRPCPDCRSARDDEPDDQDGL